MISVFCFQLKMYTELEYTSPSFRLASRPELLVDPTLGKVSEQLHTIVKQICFPRGNVLFLSLFSLFKDCAGAVRKFYLQNN